MTDGGNQEIVMKRHGKLGAIFAVLILCLGIAGWGSSTTNTPAVVFVSVSPSTVTVIGTNNAAVTNGRVP
jgi:hypothetical protein